MIVGLATIGIVALVLPHALPLDRAAPALAAATWCAALAVRALSVVYLVLYAALFLSQTELFAALTHWCWETIFPLLAAHLGIDGSHVGGGAVVLPAVILAASVLSALWGLVRAARAVWAAVRRAVVGGGPPGSVVVGGPSVLLAAMGVARPRILISAGALTSRGRGAAPPSRARRRPVGARAPARSVRSGPGDLQGRAASAGAPPVRRRPRGRKDRTTAG
jgi:hypothetical protein